MDFDDATVFETSLLLQKLFFILIPVSKFNKEYLFTKLDFSGIHTLVWPFVSHGAKLKFVRVSSGIVSHNNLKTIKLFLEAMKNDVWKGTE